MLSRVGTRLEKALGGEKTAPVQNGSKRHDTEQMEAVVWHGKHHVNVENVPRPVINDANEVLIKVTGTSICGSDMHLFNGELHEDVKTGDILGHEAVGIVQECGSAVKHFKTGDRVVCPFTIICGECWYCQHDLPTMCIATQKGIEKGNLFSNHVGTTIGYSHLIGGVSGAQASWVRVPYADSNLFKLHDDMPDEKAILLSDIACTSYHACKVLGMDQKDCSNKVVGIWGAGPVGLSIVQWCKAFKVKEIFVLDPIQNRLDYVKKIWSDVHTVNLAETKDVPKYLADRTEYRIGIDIAFDAAGFRYFHSILHQMLKAISLETSPPETLNQIILSLRKYGVMCVPSDYAGVTHGLNLGAIMEKGIGLIGTGQAPVRALIPEVQKHILDRKFDPSIILTHRFKLQDAPKVYQALDKHIYDENQGRPLIKAFIETPFSGARQYGPDVTSVPTI